MILVRGSSGPAVRNLQRALAEAGLDCGPADGVFGSRTVRALKAFQASHLDPRGVPLVPDGKAGPLTLWALEHPRGERASALVSGYEAMPPITCGGSPSGRKALGEALSELRAGSGEDEKDGPGPWVRKYLDGLPPQGSCWSVAFVSWCYREALRPKPMPFNYATSARNLYAQLRAEAWVYRLVDSAAPEPGDIVLWCRPKVQGWVGHAGLVHHAEHGILHTIEGNRGAKVQRFDYVLSRVQRLLRFARVP